MRLTLEVGWLHLDIIFGPSERPETGPGDTVTEHRFDVARARPEQPIGFGVERIRDRD